MSEGKSPHLFPGGRAAAERESKLVDHLELELQFYDVEAHWEELWNLFTGTW